jgi:hypothetical protein
MKKSNSKFNLLLRNYLFILKILPLTRLKDHKRRFFLRIFPAGVGTGEHLTNHREQNSDEGFSKHFEN